MEFVCHSTKALFSKIHETSMIQTLTDNIPSLGYVFEVFLTCTFQFAVIKTLTSAAFILRIAHIHFTNGNHCQSKTFANTARLCAQLTIVTICMTNMKTTKIKYVFKIQKCSTVL